MTTLRSVCAAAAVLAAACGAAEVRPVRAVSWNIWGDYFKNPVEDREKAVGDVLLRLDADLIFIQEATASWYRCGLFPRLRAAGYGMVGAAEWRGADWRPKAPHLSGCATPLFYRADVFTLLDSGIEFFHPKLDWSKGFAWAVLERRADGRRLVAFATHFWWKSNPESAYVRTVNADKLADRMEALARKWNGAPVVGGGDINTVCDSDAQRRLLARGFLDAQFTAPEASRESSHHGDPQPAGDGVWRGTAKTRNTTREYSIDHLYYTKPFAALRMKVVTDTDAFDASDHYPIFVDLRFAE